MITISVKVQGQKRPSKDVINNKLLTYLNTLYNKLNMQRRLIMYSFEQWCIDNNRKDFLEAWDYELNSDMPNDIGYSTSKKRYFKCKFYR